MRPEYGRRGKLVKRGAAFKMNTDLRRFYTLSRAK